MLTMVEELDYVPLPDDRTRKEVERRYDGLRKTVAAYISLRSAETTTILPGRDTVLQLYSLLMMGSWTTSEAARSARARTCTS
jgi:hypothetical protein